MEDDEGGGNIMKVAHALALAAVETTLTRMSTSFGRASASSDRSLSNLARSVLRVSLIKSSVRPDSSQ